MAESTSREKKTKLDLVFKFEVRQINSSRHFFFRLKSAKVQHEPGFWVFCCCSVGLGRKNAKRNSGEPTKRTIRKKDFYGHEGTANRSSLKGFYCRRKHCIIEGGTRNPLSRKVQRRKRLRRSTRFTPSSLRLDQLFDFLAFVLFFCVKLHFISFVECIFFLGF